MKPESSHARSTTPSVVKAAAIKRLRKRGLKRERANARLVNDHTPFNVVSAEKGAPVGFQSGLGHGKASRA